MLGKWVEMLGVPAFVLFAQTPVTNAARPNFSWKPDSTNHLAVNSSQHVRED